METVLPTTPVERLERTLGALTPAELDLAERLQAIGREIASRIDSIELFDARNEDPNSVAGETSAAVRTALLEIAAQAAMDALETRLSDLDRRVAFLTELRASLLDRDDPGPADPNPTGPLYDLFADSSEILPLERRVRRLAMDATRRVLAGMRLPEHAPLASFGERGCAFALDWGAAQTLAHVWLVIAFAVHLIHRGRHQAFAVVVLVHFAVGVFNAFLLARGGASLGKYAMHLRVVDAGSARPVPIERTLLRETLGRLVTICFFLADLTVFPSPLRQTRADRWAHSIVIRDERELPHRTLALAGAGLLLFLTVAYFAWGYWTIVSLRF